MQLKYLKLLLLGSLFCSVAGYAILHSDLNASATGDFLIRLGDGLFYGSGALALVFLLLLLVPRAYPAWKKFAVWFVPLAAILFAIYPNPGSGDLFAPYPEQVYRWVSGFYVLASGLIIVRTSVRKPATL